MLEHMEAAVCCRHQKVVVSCAESGTKIERGKKDDTHPCQWSSTADLTPGKTRVIGDSFGSYSSVCMLPPTKSESELPAKDVSSKAGKFPNQSSLSPKIMVICLSGLEHQPRKYMWTNL